MGISPSKRVKTSLTTSQNFTTACNLTFIHCLSLTQHAFNHILPYQLSTASAYLHTLLTTTHPHPLVLKWASSPPSRSHIDDALKAVVHKHGEDKEEEEVVLGLREFEEWAVELFASFVLESIEGAVVRRVGVGVVGIVGVGAVGKVRRGVVGSLAGAYVAVVASWVYLVGIGG